MRRGILIILDDAGGAAQTLASVEIEHGTVAISEEVLLTPADRGTLDGAIDAVLSAHEGIHEIVYTYGAVN